MANVKFIRCGKCGNLMGVVNDSGVMPICCGQPMEQLVPNSTDGAGEKHVPVIERDGHKITVRVGSAAHPMLDEHYIQWIALAGDKKVQRVRLNPGDAPVATFSILEDGPVTAYEYCNLHGLWKAEG